MYAEQQLIFSFINLHAYWIVIAFFFHVCMNTEFNASLHHLMQIYF